MIRCIIRCYTGGWRNIFNYKGCASRKEFWGFILINLLALNLYSAITGMLTLTGNGIIDILLYLSMGFSLQLLFISILIIPVMSLGVRRMHDIGRSGWWFSSLLLSNIFIIPAFLGALVSSIANHFSWDIALSISIWASLVLNLSVIFYLTYLCCKPSVRPSPLPH
ncbi:DUF805 domain-containing protein [Pantoea trifolii]|uniref:DUF805 domain-containing protein n=1 Tax=Pantoea trifolii TaxID=2968030 RepID=A0ABT1VKQ0_9GAMM|nr:MULTISPECIES: DUF805 domain-containing protein [unclassified Pantoea]MCQ8228103.1 DUF805 domain-containing protein [Pantoea sp. MMK2]MCQ8236276.1 DUF805 domain-containing protein [Pantoea sp. MMK3]